MILEEKKVKELARKVCFKLALVCRARYNSKERKRNVLEKRRVYICILKKKKRKKNFLTHTWSARWHLLSRDPLKVCGLKKKKNNKKKCDGPIFSIAFNLLFLFAPGWWWKLCGLYIHTPCNNTRVWIYSALTCLYCKRDITLSRQ